MADPVCPTDHGELCRLVYESTGNAWVAKASNWLIAKPLSILALVVIGIVIRWLLHRAIDKITRDVNLSETILRVLMTDATHLTLDEMKTMEPQQPVKEAPRRFDEAVPAEATGF